MKKRQIDRERRLSGFTLMEIVVVVAIISILLVLLLPTMRGYLTNSRLSTVNSEAKVLYNSIQTIMQEYEFRERQMPESAFYGSHSDKKGEFFLKGVNGTIDTAMTVTSSPGDSRSSASDFVYSTGTVDIIGANLGSADAATFNARLSRLYSDYTQVSWAAYIEDYTVRGVFCAENETSEYVGGYPLRASSRTSDPGCEIGQNVTILNCTITDMQTYSVDAWKVSSSTSGGASTGS